MNNMEYQRFLSVFIETLNKHAPLNLRADQGRFMAKNLHNSFMKRSRLRNKFLSDRTEMFRKEYKNNETFA